MCNTPGVQGAEPPASCDTAKTRYASLLAYRGKGTGLKLVTFITGMDRGVIENSFTYDTRYSSVSR